MKIPWIVLIVAAFGFPAGASRADVTSRIAGIERMPRAIRLAAYERAVADNRITPQERIEFIRAFAKHAKVLSPLLLGTASF